MSKIAKSFVELIGKTPLLAATRFGESVGADANILAKLEYFNPGGSVKDRIAAAIIQAAVASGELQPGGTIVEATSGNTGIGLSAVGAALGYKAVSYTHLMRFQMNFLMIFILIKWGFLPWQIVGRIQVVLSSLLPWDLRLISIINTPFLV